MTGRAINVRHPGFIGWMWRAAICGFLALPACNLGFDAGEFGPIPQDETDTGDDPSGCTDDDGDGFGVGADCPADQRDCDDTRARVFPGANEECDSVDNDCDDEIDEGPMGGPLTESCYTGEDAELDAEATACVAGTVTCVDGAFPDATEDTCEGQVLPSNAGETEDGVRCDGIDNDCDGEIDPECDCPEEGLVEDCYTAGPAEAAGKGICAFGTHTCERQEGGDLEWSDCEGDVAPGVEDCGNTGSDDNCDEIEDNIEGLGVACETDEPGRCRPGSTGCFGADLVCVRNDNPIEEVCDGLDNDCDGELDNGVANACGGCVDLGERSPNDPCGECQDGRLVCADEGRTLVCEGGSDFNACGGCVDLEAQPEEPCGDCGEFICDGQDAVRCSDPGQNACNGCGPVNGGNSLDDDCGQCGTVVCDGENDTTCDDPGQNICGGCTDLGERRPGDICGPCEDGRLACSEDSEALLCQGETPINACGGCQPTPPGGLNGPCGPESCGTLGCDPNNVGEFVCDDPGANACDGCGELPNTPNAPCGQCGTFVCQDGTTVCDDPGRNTCGGCQPLEGLEGADCGECGELECSSEESIFCNDPGRNGCNGCAILEGEPDSPCGVCGEFKCTINPNVVVCDDPGLNTCDGCGDIVGPPIGDDCGICGEFVCDGPNASVCEDPGLNVCDGCADLPDAPGSDCGPCAAFRCNGGEGTVCDNRQCFNATIALRLFNNIPTLDAIDIVAEYTTLPGVIDPAVFTGVNYRFTTPFYIEGPGGTYNIKAFPAGADRNVVPPVLDRDLQLSPGDEVTAMFFGREIAPNPDFDLLVLNDDNAAVEGMVKLRYVNANPDRDVVTQLLADGELIATNISYGNVTEYLIPAAAPIRRISFVHGGSSLSFNLGVPLLGGNVYTLSHIGRVGDEDFPELLNSINDRIFPINPL